MQQNAGTVSPTKTKQLETVVGVHEYKKRILEKSFSEIKMGRTSPVIKNKSTNPMI